MNDILAKKLELSNIHYIKDELDSSCLMRIGNIDEISLLPKERISLTGEDLDSFNKLLDALDAVDDVRTVYHNVEL